MADRGAIVVDTGPGALLDGTEAVAKALGEGLRDGVERLKRGLDGAAAGFARAARQAKGLLAAMMQTANVATGLDRGLSNLYRYARAHSQALRRGLDGLATTALYLRNSLAAMAGPLMTAMAPAVDAVADRFVDMFNVVNQLFARLAGSDTYIAARRFGDRWDSEAGRVRGALAAVRRYVMGFDEIQILGGGSGSGAWGGGDGAMFEERRIEDGVAGFADRLREAFESGDWDGLGRTLGSRINALVDAVDWQKLGKRVGRYLNGAFKTAYALLDEVNFENIGARVAEFLNGALDEIDFGTVGATVALFFTSMVETFAGFVRRFDWAQFARKAADAVNGFVEALAARLDKVDWAALTERLTRGVNGFIRSVDWAKLGSTLAGRVNDLLAILGTAARSFDWAGAGGALATGLNRLFRSVDWARLGDWLQNTLSGLLDFGIAFLERFDAAAFCENVKAALGRVDWAGVAQKLWQLMALALQKLGEAANTLLFGGSTQLGVDVDLKKRGWSSISDFVGTLVTVSTNLTRDGGNWPRGLLAWFKGEAGGNVVELIGKLLMRDDAASWWADVKRWFGRETRGDALEMKAGVADTASDWWSGIVKWFKRDGKAEGNRLELRAQMGDTASDWWSGIVKWFRREGKAEGNRLELKAQMSDTATDWWSGILKWFRREGKAEGNRLELRAQMSDTATDWWSGIVKWFRREGKAEGNRLELSARVKDESGTWWDGIVKWFNRGGEQWWNRLEMSASVKDESGDWWSGIKKWFDRDGAYWWNALELHAQVKNESGSWWDSVVGWWNGVRQTLGFNVAAQGGSFAGGGYVTDSGRVGAFASGGVVDGRRATWFDAVRKYASGTGRAHGTVFVAGEAGPEVVGHVNGRTEILNKSQLAQAMYGAVASGMGAAVNALGRYLAGHMTACANAICGCVAVAAGGVEYHPSALAMGSVLPYDIAAQIARTGASLEKTLNDNNEDLIQTIISVSAQVAAAVRVAPGAREARGGLTAQQMIEEINRRAQMFGTSPIMGV